jgi:putative nucleotidyltransferase with HDIG domain
MNSRERVAEVLRNVKTLPTLPDVAVRLIEMGDNPSVSTTELAELVEEDVALATRLLKLVNSPFFGVRREVESVQQALMILGMSNLRSLVLSGAALELFDRTGSVGTFSRKEFWIHSVAVAGAARTIAAKKRVVDPEVAFTAGLIHDMGKVVVDRYMHREFERIVRGSEEPGVTMREAEQAVLGVSHAEIGHHLASHWNLPDILCEAVRLHHEPGDDPTSSRIAGLIAIADSMVRGLKIGCGGGADHPLEPSLLQLCGLTADDYDRIENDLEEILEEQVRLLAGDP